MIYTSFLTFHIWSYYTPELCERNVIVILLLRLVISGISCEFVLMNRIRKLFFLSRFNIAFDLVHLNAVPYLPEFSEILYDVRLLKI